MADRPVAIVTGGARGIGLGIARALAADGWDLALAGVRGLAAVGSTIDALRAGTSRVQYVQADISVTADRRRLVEETLATFGSISALVNNAGRAPRVRADLLEATEESFEDLVRTNVQGPYFLSQAVARHMIDAPAGSERRGIVFITSVSAEMVSLQRGDYCVSKAGLAMAAKLFAARLARHGIPVFDVRPGIIATDMTAAVRDVYDRRISEGLVPEGRWGTPADIGRVVAALLRGDAPYATGSIVHVDGGLTIPRL